MKETIKTLRNLRTHCRNVGDNRYVVALSHAIRHLSKTTHNKDTKATPKSCPECGGLCTSLDILTGIEICIKCKTLMDKTS